MYRSLSLYPTSADPAKVEEHVFQAVAAFKQSPGFISCTTSVDALMGPGAKEGDISRVLVVDFETLDDALNALMADNFRELHAAAEELAVRNFMFDCRPL